MNNKYVASLFIVIFIFGIFFISNCSNKDDPEVKLFLLLEEAIPMEDSIGVIANGNLQLTFDEDVSAVANKNITITSSDTTDIIISITSPQVTINNNIVTINPDLPLNYNTIYTVIIDSGGFENEAQGKNSKEIQLSFTTEILLNPIIVTTIPNNSDTDVAVDANIVLTFNVDVTAVTGKNITITPIGQSAIIIPVTDSQVTINNNIVTINPTNNLIPGIVQIVSISAGAFENSDNIPIANEKLFSFTTLAEPTIVTTIPDNNDIDVAVDANIVLTFNVDVTAVTGKNITITPSGQAAITIPVTDSQVTVNNNIVTINPANNLIPGIVHTVSIPAGAFENSDNIATGNAKSFSFTTIEAPIIVTTTPDNNDIDIALDANIVLTFNVDVTAVTGKNITITPSGQSAMIIPVTDPQVIVNNNIVTINPILIPRTVHTVSIPAGAFENSDNIATGNAKSFSFTTLEETPIIVTTIPDNNDTDVAVDANIVLTFNVDVTAVTGKNITITPSGQADITIPVTDSQVTVNNNTVTINPADDFFFGSSYQVTIPAGAFKNNDNIAMANPRSFSFNTLEVPIIVTTRPSNNDTGISISTNIGLTFSEIISAVSGKNITITPSGQADITIPVTDSQVTVSNDIVTINPANNLMPGIVHTVSIPAGAFENSDNIATGNAKSFSFTTLEAPIILTTTPSDGGTEIPPKTVNIVLNFNVNVTAVSGDIIFDVGIPGLFSTAFSTTFGDFELSVTDSQVTINNNIVTINLTDDLLFDRSYKVTIPAGAFKNNDNVPTVDYTFIFDTDSRVEIEMTSPINGATGVPVDANIILTFSEDVVAGIQDQGQSISITHTGGGGLLDFQLTINNNIVIINPVDDFDPDTQFIVNIPRGFFENNDNLDNEGYTISFRTVSSTP